ncbi:hypothetical protein [Agrobacterium tumefaciens]|uniref:hypothetical protein n=1 Tax=Agrobacterium tumefaciens TaxID=358 RepID=UPI001659D0AD|nr:hypothetical protein [Agrobacterium tumefaciens]QNP81021.1 hypothetical protein IAI05_07230 [Agrobacterium tumefaciens]
MQSEVQCAEATVDDHLRNLIQLMKRGGRISVTDIPNDPTFLSSHFGGPTAQAIADRLEAALSAAEPVRWMWEERRFAESDIWDDMYDDEPPAPQKYVRNIRPLYAAPPAPSVAVEHLITEVHDAIDEYREGMKGDKFGPHEWPTVDGIKTTVAQSLRRSALSAQVQDVAVPEGWKLVPVEPTSEMEDAARHLMMWLDFARPTEAALIAHCKRLGKEPPPECRDVDHVPPKAMRLFWVYRAMIAAAPAKQEG